MNKMLFKNAWILAGLLLVINIILGLIIFAIVEFFNIGDLRISGVAGILGAMTVGQIYTMKFKEVMPKKMRINVTLIYILAQMLLGSLYIFILSVSNYPLFFGTLIGFSLFYSLFIYWMLGVGGKTYLQALQKRKAAKRNFI